MLNRKPKPPAPVPGATPPPLPEPEKKAEVRVPTVVPKAVEELGPEAVELYKNAETRELTFEQWQQKIEEFVYGTLSTMKNHKETIDSLQERVAKLETVEQRVAALEGLFNSAEEQARKKQPRYLS